MIDLWNALSTYGASLAFCACVAFVGLVSWRAVTSTRARFLRERRELDSPLDQVLEADAPQAARERKGTQ